MSAFMNFLAEVGKGKRILFLIVFVALLCLLLLRLM